MANDLSAFEPDTWSTRMVEKLDQYNIMLGLVNRYWEGDLRQSKSVKVRTPGNIAMAPYTRGTTISYQDLSPTLETFTVNDGQYFAIEVDDIDRAQSDLDALDIYMRRAVVEMNNVVERKLMGAYTYAPAANIIGGAGIALDPGTSTATGIYQQFIKVRTIMGNNNVPLVGRWAVIDPETAGLLFQDTAHFVRASDLGDAIVQEGFIGPRGVQNSPGFIGKVLDFAVYETPHVVTAGGAKQLMFGDNDAISYAAQITEMETLRLQTTFANAIRGLLLHDTFVPAESAKRLVVLRALPVAA
jgi:P22 coat protein - gene protein 5